MGGCDYSHPEIDFVEVVSEAGVCTSEAALHSGFDRDDSYYDGWEE